MSADNGAIGPDSNNTSFQEDVLPNFDGVPSQALDAVRMRSAQLTHSLRRIRDELSKAELPQWYSLQAQLNVTLSQLMSLTSTLHHFQDTLDSTVVYPLPNFPTTSHEGLLTTLLRKKNIPEVDEWISSAKESSDLDLKISDARDVDKSLQDDKDITKWALQTFVSEFEKYNFKGLHTQEEIDLDISDNAMDSSVNNGRKPIKPFDVDDILRFTYKGEIPRQSKDAITEVTVLD